MAILTKPFYDLDEVCTQWGLNERDLTAFVLSGDLTLSATVAGLRVVYGYFECIDVDEVIRIPEGRRVIIGTANLERDDAWTVLRKGNHGITQLQAPDDKFIEIDNHASGGVHVVDRDDLVVRREEMERFAAVHLAGAAAREEYAPRRGAPQKYDWDRFWTEVCRRVHEEGVPATQGEFVRLMLDWFGKNDMAEPDQSTVKKKLSPLWRQIAPREIEAPIVRSKRA
ncbi:hypothetical protein [Pararhizobium haloflavum]|uniref:hypothetical protein n=1 Tax=Pararhizobium haloflavum TaxID=2037914 RepID=UPI000C19CFFE|nr:hypothetical protein [Pararhizobium haloflavum]